jgi:hypothetical protein
VKAILEKDFIKNRVGTLIQNTIIRNQIEIKEKAMDESEKENDKGDLNKGGILDGLETAGGPAGDDIDTKNFLKGLEDETKKKGLDDESKRNSFIRKSGSFMLKSGSVGKSLDLRSNFSQKGSGSEEKKENAPFKRSKPKQVVADEFNLLDVLGSKESNDQGLLAELAEKKSKVTK